MQRSSPVISVILPVYNSERYVGEAIKSILTQTFNDFELILIDDGSTDGSHDVLKHYATQDSRVVLISRENRGLVASLNEGIELARGEWIARMDADDIALPYRFELQMAHLIKSDSTLCGGAVQCFGDWKAVWRYPSSHEACEVQLLFDVPFAHPTVIGRKEMFRALQYDPEFKYVEDYDLWQRAWMAGYRMTNLPDVVVRYRVHKNQVSRQRDANHDDRCSTILGRHWQAVVPNIDSESIEVAIDFILGKGVGVEELAPHLNGLLIKHHGEARIVLLDNIFKVLCRRSGGDKQAARLWRMISMNNGHWPVGAIRLFILLILSRFQIKSDMQIFRLLQQTRALLISLIKR